MHATVLPHKTIQQGSDITVAEAQRQTWLKADEFRRACLHRGADGHGEIAELLGVHRTTVLRAMEHDSQVGPGLFAAMVTVFGPMEAAGLIEIVTPTRVA